MTFEKRTLLQGLTSRLLAAFLLFAGLSFVAGCEDMNNDGGFEDTGEEIDDMVDDAGDDLEDAADDIEDEFD